MKAREWEAARQTIPLLHRAKVPGESCEYNLAKLGAACAVVPARLPLLQFGPFQGE